MNILFKGLSLACIALSLNASTLKEIIQSTLQNNENLKAQNLQTKAKQKTYQSVKNIYNPNLNVGANYTRLDLDTRAVQVGTTATAFLKLNINLYDGGKNKALKRQKFYEYESSRYLNTNDKKQTLLNVVTLFFQAKTVIENIKVFEEKSKLLKAEYERVKDRYNLKMATIDEVLKLQSEYEANKYTIEELKYQKTELLKNLSLLTGEKITNLDNSHLPEVKNLSYTQSSNIKALELSLKATQENINITSSIKKPQVKLEDSLNYFKYYNYNEKLLPDLPTKQNQFSLTLTYNLFDTSSKEKIESAKLIKLASATKLSYAKKQEKMEFDLAKQKLKTQVLKLQSLKSTVEMGNSVYKIVKTKYNNGVVDNITYLDALNKKIYNEALYRQALNDYEIAKANYYFKSGIDYKKVIKKF